MTEPGSSSEPLYDILLIGAADAVPIRRLKSALDRIIGDSGVEESDVRISTNRREFENFWSLRRPTVVVCFSSPTSADLKLVENLSKSRIPVIPIAVDDERFHDFPKQLQPLNGATVGIDDESWDAAAIAVLDCVGLLREQRRLFISYRRADSRSAAVQLYDELSGSGFDVFLDTHAIRPGRVFQDDLWQQLCDSDVVLMLDTKGYFESHWTREEFGRAQSLGIYILRLIWPGHKVSRATELATSRSLDCSEIINGLIHDDVVHEITGLIEKIRARGIAARYTEITGKLLEEIKGIGATLIGTGAYRTVAVRLKGGDVAWAYPVVGVPTATLMNDVALRAKASKHEGPYLVYDHAGISEPWLEHLQWLDDYIPEVDFMRVSDAGSVLRRRKRRGSP